MFRNYFKIAWRNAIKNRSYAVISLSSLILGITLFFLISIWIRGELSYDTHFKSAAQICRLENTLIMPDGKTSTLPAVGWPVGKILQKQYPEIEHLTYMRYWAPNIYNKGEHFYEDALYADNEFFNVFGYELQEGSTATALAGPYSLVISRDLEKKYFGEGQALGKILMVNDTIPYKVTGVFKDLAAPSHLKFDMIGSFATFCSMYPKDCAEEFATGWFDVNVYNYIRISKRSSRVALESKIKDLVLQYGKEAIKSSGFKSTLSLRPVSDIYLYSGMTTGKGTMGSYKTIRLFLLIGIFILLIACLNFINLTTAKSVERAKEIGIKKVLGTDRRKLIFQFLTEAAFLCLVAAIISMLLVIALLPLFNQFTGKSFTSASFFSVGNMLLLSAIIILLIPIAGFYPAWVLSSFKPISILKGNFTHTASGTLLRKILVITQFIISAGFIMSTMIIWKQMQFMQNQDLGFNKDKLLLVDVDKIPWGLRNDKASVYKTILSAEAGIKKVTACGAVPGRTGWDGQFAYPEGKTTQQALVVEYIAADADYVKTIGLQLVAGRDFFPDSKKDENESFIINESAVQSFGWGNPGNAIGRKLNTSGKEGKVVGVVKDYHQHGFQRQIDPVVLSPIHSISLFALRFEGIAPGQAIADVRAAWNQVFKGYPLEYRFLDEDFQRQYQKEEKVKNFFGLAALLSIAIACLGLFGLTMYIAQRRVKEIGVRKVLGATVTDIVGMIAADLLKPVCIAIVIATPIVWLTMHNWLQDFAYRTTISWWVFATAGIAALLIALVTVSFRAIKAAVANPVKSLRTE